MLFADILGQEKAVTYLQKLARTDRARGSYLFYGPEGVGKKQTALAFAKALNCQDNAARQTGSACGVCPSCTAIENGTHPDVTLVDFVFQARMALKKDIPAKDYQEELEKALAKQQVIRVDTIREACIRAQQKPAGNGYKVLIVDHAQTLQQGTGSAANALLKFIEEPPERTLWILITAKREAMLPTIRSRCQPVPFGALKPDALNTVLTQRYPELYRPDLAAQYGGGSVSGAVRAAEALELLQQGGFGTLPAPVYIASSLSRTLSTARRQAQDVLDVLIRALHRAWKEEQNPARQAALRATLADFGQYKQAIVRNVSPALVLENALMELDGAQLNVF